MRHVSGCEATRATQVARPTVSTQVTVGSPVGAGVGYIVGTGVGLSVVEQRSQVLSQLPASGHWTQKVVEQAPGRLCKMRAQFELTSLQSSAVVVGTRVAACGVGFDDGAPVSAAAMDVVGPSVASGVGF